MSIHLLTDRGDKAGVSSLIASGENVNVNEPDSAGETPLHYASIRGHSEVAVILISHGADPNIKSDRGVTPLHDAAKHGKLDTVTCLVDSNADIEAKDISNNKIPLHYAVESGNVRIVNKLLEKNPAAQINALSKDGITPLHLASSRGSLHIIKTLIEKGAKLDVRDHKGNAALAAIPLVGE
jgi:ankyrin repeat protein